MKANHFLKIARKASLNSDHHTHKLGAVVVKRNRVLGMGFNVMKTHPESPHDYKYIHAEFMAIHNIEQDDLKGATIYIFRQHKNGCPANSKPCESCYNYLLKKGIKEIVYSDNEGYKVEVVA